MTIQIGDRLPEATLVKAGDSPEQVTTTDFFAGRRVALFAVPGAFTPTCSEQHLPGFVEKFPEFRARGVDVACMAVNDPFVMQAWMRSQSVPEGLRMVADGNAELTRALGLELDASAYGMGFRSKRFALLVEDGVVRQVFVEAPGEFRVSTADHVLEQIG